MNKIVYLVRHGLIRSNEEDVYAGRNSEKLTERGKNRAEQLGLEIEGWGIQLIQTSPLRRTVQTAEILNRYCNAELIKDPDLIEIDLGPWSGLSKDEVRRRYPD
ncbi:MAG: histidine phosphatase family protein, partial [Desulfoferrobacter sp.]